MSNVPIRSVQNPRIKAAIKLRERKWRDRLHQLLIDGNREIEQALASSLVVQTAFVCETAYMDENASRIIGRLQQVAKEIVYVTPGVYARLAFGDRAEGIVLLAESPSRTLGDLALPGEPLVAVVEGVEKPGNLGAVLRTADGAGVAAVIHADGVTDLWNPNTIRASLGTVFKPNVRAATTRETIAWLAEQGFAVLTTRPDATLSYHDAQLAGRPTAIVLGSEAHGLSAAWRKIDATAIRLPMHGLADSLNLSATAAVLFYEALRQRTDRAGAS